MKKRFSEWKFRSVMRVAENLSDAVLAFLVSEAIMRYAERTTMTGADTSYQQDIMWDLVDFLLPNPPEKERAVE